MWGGLSRQRLPRQVFNSKFTKWEPAHGLNPLRRFLFDRTEPWYLFLRLHGAKHSLDDSACANLLSIASTGMQISSLGIQKQHIIKMINEMMGAMVQQHRYGHLTTQAFFRSCAIAGDLTNAYEWFNYLTDEGYDHPLRNYSLLLRAAIQSPCDDQAEEMAEAVRELYEGKYCSSGEDSKNCHGEDGDERLLLFGAFRNLLPRILGERLRRWILRLPEPSESFRLEMDWDKIFRAKVCSFSGLASAPFVLPLENSVAKPYIRDSLLHPEFRAEIQREALSFNVKGVAEKIQEYLQSEKEFVGNLNHVKEREQTTRGLKIWCSQKKSAESFEFRKSLLREKYTQAGGVTPELYHYLILSMSRDSPSLAVKTADSVRDSKMELFDITRAVLIKAVHPNRDFQKRYLSEQYKSCERRKAYVDDNPEVAEAFNLYWRFNYSGFLESRNAMTMTEFLIILVDGIGLLETMDLVYETELFGERDVLETAGNLVVVSEDVRNMISHHLKQSRGVDAVNKAMDFITMNCPKLDLAMVGSCVQFSDYVLPSSDHIATNVVAMKGLLSSFRSIFVLDSSFIEAGADFAALRSKFPNALVLVPFSVLHQLSRMATGDDGNVVLDKGVVSEVEKERSRSLECLRSLRDSIKAGTARVLHFSETLLSHMFTDGLFFTPSDLSSSEKTEMRFQGSASGWSRFRFDNDELIAITIMIRALVSEKVDVYLCSDDPLLRRRLLSPTLKPSLQGIQLLESQEKTSYEGVQVEDAKEIQGSIPTEFEPVLRSPALAVKVFQEGDYSGKNTLHHQNEQDSEGPKALDGDLLFEMMSTGETDAVSDSEVVKVEETKSVECVAEMTSPWMIEDDEVEDESVPERLISHQELVENELKNDGSASILVEGGDGQTAMTTSSSSSSDVDPSSISRSPFEPSSLDLDIKKAARETLQTFGNEFSGEEYSMGPGKEEFNQGTPQKARKRNRVIEGMATSAKLSRPKSKTELERIRRSVSGFAGCKVPLNFRYKVVRANINDPRNKHLLEEYKKGMVKKRNRQHSANIKKDTDNNMW